MYKTVLLPSVGDRGISLSGSPHIRSATVGVAEADTRVFLQLSLGVHRVFIHGGTGLGHQTHVLRKVTHAPMLLVQFRQRLSVEKQIGDHHVFRFVLGIVFSIKTP